MFSFVRFPLLPCLAPFAAPSPLFHSSYHILDYYASDEFLSSPDCGRVDLRDALGVVLSPSSISAHFFSFLVAFSSPLSSFSHFVIIIYSFLSYFLVSLNSLPQRSFSLVPIRSRRRTATASRRSSSTPRPTLRCPTFTPTPATFPRIFALLSRGGALTSYSFPLQAVFSDSFLTLV